MEQPLRVAVGLSLALLLASTASLADDPRLRARQHFDRALAHLEKDELRQALAEFRAAQELHPHYAVLYNIGKVHVALGEPALAIEHLERYLELGGEHIAPERRGEVEQLVVQQSAKVGRITLDVKPAGATISVDGSAVGKTPLARPLLLGPGKHTLSASLGGHRAEQRSIEVVAGSRATVDFELEPAASVLGRLGIECPLSNVTVRVDQLPHATTPVAELLIPIGARTIRFERPGYRADQQSVLVSERGSASVRCQMQALNPLPPERSGRIEIALKGPHVVRIDGVRAPADGRVPYGVHRIEVRALGFRPWSGSARVEPGKTTRLEPELVPDDATLRARQAQRTWAYALGAHGVGLLTAAGIMYVWNTTRHSEWRDEQKNLDADWDRGGTAELAIDQTQNDEQLESIRRFDRVTVGIAVTGGALLTAGVVVYLLGDDPNPRGKPTLVASAGGASAAWRWSW